MTAHQRKEVLSQKDRGEETLTAIARSPGRWRRAVVSNADLAGGDGAVPASTLNFSASYTWDNEGKMTGVNYPVLGACGGMACGSGTTNGPTYTFGFDTMSRLNAMTRTDGTAATIANNVVYNVADQMTSFGMPLGGNGTESRSYNSLFQLTNITRTWNTATQMNLTYNYTAGSDNGKIASMTDAVSGETVSYAYDSLNRLISATAKSGTTTVWGNSFGFDGFGNLLSKTVTGGTAPTLSQTVNTATNHINAYTYDSNGNQTTVPVAGSGNVNAGYDIQNRMTLLGSVGSPTAQYAYGAANQRVWRMATESGTTKEWFYFYGIDGQRMASYQVTVVTPVQGNSYTSAVTVQAADVLVYFGRKMLMEGSWSGIGSFSASYVGVDRLGSIPGGAKLFAWGEEVTVTGNDKIKFATYLRDGESGIDYAMNRYYGSGLGRFLSVDPFGGSASTSNPQSWNRYAYALDDPANENDSSGLVVPDCEDILPKIFNDLRVVINRYLDLVYAPNPPGTGSWNSHVKAYQQRQNALKNDLKQWNNQDCGDPPMGSGDWASKTAPTKQDYVGSKGERPDWLTVLMASVGAMDFLEQVVPMIEDMLPLDGMGAIGEDLILVIADASSATDTSQSSETYTISYPELGVTQTYNSNDPQASDGHGVDFADN